MTRWKDHFGNIGVVGEADDNSLTVTDPDGLSIRFQQL